MLRAALARPDLDLRIVDHLPDDIAATRQALGRAAQDCDLVVTTGGVSVGEEDHLRAAVRDLGGREIFAGVAIKPGKPVAFGRLGGALWLGLPGNPQSAFVTWALFGEPILAGLSGCAGADRPGHRARLSHPVRRRPGRCELRPARVVGWDATGRARVEAAAPVRSGQVGCWPCRMAWSFCPPGTGTWPQARLSISCRSDRKGDMDEHRLYHGAGAR